LIVVGVDVVDSVMLLLVGFTFWSTFVPAVVAVVALVALSALVAWAAFVALGTVTPLKFIFDPITAPFVICFVPTAPLWSFLVVTAPFLSCLVPTLFFGTMRAAKLVPPTATNSATAEMTSAGLGRCT
jgi:hypothetical protein